MPTQEALRRVIVQPLDAAGSCRTVHDVATELTRLSTVQLGDMCRVGNDTFRIIDTTPTTRGVVTSTTTTVVVPYQESHDAADDNAAVPSILSIDDIVWPTTLSTQAPRLEGIVCLPSESLLAAACLQGLEEIDHLGELLALVSSGVRRCRTHTHREASLTLNVHHAAMLGLVHGSLCQVTAAPGLRLRAHVTVVRDEGCNRALSSLAAIWGCLAVAIVDGSAYHSLRARSTSTESNLFLRLPVDAMSLILAKDAEEPAFASRAVFANLSALDPLVTTAADAALARELRRRARCFREGDIVNVTLAQHGAGSFDPVRVEAILADECAAASTVCAHIRALHFRLEVLEGGTIVDPSRTEVSLAGPSSSTPHVGRVPPAMDLTPLSVAVQVTSPFAKLTRVLATPARAGRRNEWCRLSIVGGTPANVPAAMTKVALAVTGWQTIEIDAPQLDAPTTLSLLARTCFEGAAVLVRHMDRLDVNSELARWCIGAATQASWAREEIDSKLPTELQALAPQRRVFLILCFEGNDPPAPAFTAVANEPPIICGMPDDAGREAVIDAVLSLCTSRDGTPTAPRLSIGCSAATLASWSTGLGVADLVVWITTAVTSHAAQYTRGDTIAVVDSCDLEKALKAFQAQHGHSLTSTKLQPVKWDDVGGLEQAKKEILETIELPLKHPELFEGGAKQRAGVLMYGPPGCGKTLLAKAIATEMGLNFISVKGPELINMYVGESEKNIRLLFQRARDNSPCICFFDELDALAPKRGAKGDSGGVMDRIVAQLLSEVDGVGGTKSDGSPSGQVFIIGATNRPDLLDPSLLRPGRFDRLCYLGPPSNKKEQLAAVKALTRKFKLAPDVDLAAVVEPLEPIYSGADYFALCSDAMMLAVNEAVERLRTIALSGEAVSGQQPPLLIERRHFEAARAMLKPSVSPSDLKRYEAMKYQFAASQSKAA